MALYFSTGLRDLMAGKVAAVAAKIVGATCAFVDGGAGADTITDSGNGFVAAGFVPGLCEVFGATTAANDGTYVITGVAQGTLTFATGSFNTAETFAAGTVLCQCKGGSLKDILRDGIIEIFTGSAPATADAAETGTKLARITVASGAWVAGAFGNGLELGVAASGVIAKDTDVWSGLGLINPSGIAGYFRWKANATDAGGSSTSLPRIQGMCGVGTSYDLNMTSTTLYLNATLTIDTWSLTFPAS